MTSKNDPFDYIGFDECIKKVLKIVDQEIRKAVQDPDVKIKNVCGRWYLTGPKSKVNEFETRVMSRIWKEGGIDDVNH